MGNCDGQRIASSVFAFAHDYAADPGYGFSPPPSHYGAGEQDRVLGPLSSLVVKSPATPNGAMGRMEFGPVSAIRPGFSQRSVTNTNVGA